jgi:hypothetical protein
MLTNPNVHELSLNRGDELITVSLRLTTAGQITLKKHWNENTVSTLFGAIDDIEKFADVLTQALNYPGNQNVIRKGDELADLLADNDLLGIANKQKLMTAIGRASGILSEAEREKMDKNADKMFDGLNEDEEGNA